MDTQLESSADHTQLAAEIAAMIGAAGVVIEAAQRLPGYDDAARWRLDVSVAGGPHAGRHAWTLAVAPLTRLPLAHDRATEWNVMQAAADAGLTVPPLIASADRSEALGQAYWVQRHVAGISPTPHDDPVGEPSEHAEAQASALARDLARLHAVTPQAAQLSCLPVPAQPPARALVARLREALGKASVPRPALEYILSWLDQHAPPARGLVLVHGDLRPTNIIADGGTLTAMNGWQFAHWGDPDEDIGSFMASFLPAGTNAAASGDTAARQAFLQTYQQASARTVSSDAVRYWQIMAAARSATVAVLEGDRFRIGGEARLDLALAGLTPAQFEHDALADILAWKRDLNGGPRWLA